MKPSQSSHQTALHLKIAVLTRKSIWEDEITTEQRHADSASPQPSAEYDGVAFSIECDRAHVRRIKQIWFLNGRKMKYV